MRRKERRSLFIVGVAYLYLAGVNSFGAASGNYTDLLPIGAPGNTTVISNGSGWSLTTLAPSQTFGDALSRAPMTVFQSTATGSISNTTAVSTITALGQGSVGSTTFPASWVATGRTIRVTESGYYTTISTGTNWTWAILLGTTTILSTNAKAAIANQTGQYWRATALITIAATGASGTANATYEIIASSAAAAQAPNLVSYSTATAAAVSVDLTSQLTVNPTFTWAQGGCTLVADNVLVEFLN